MTSGKYPRTQQHKQQLIANLSHASPSGRFKKGCSTWNTGLKGYNSDLPRSQEWRDKIALSHTGEKCYLWKGGVSTQNELLRKRQAFKHWRLAVFERDNYTCRDCGDRSRAGHRIKIHPHHIKLLSEYPELAYDVDNGLTLCFDCHQKRHPNLILACFKD